MSFSRISEDPTSSKDKGNKRKKSHHLEGNAATHQLVTAPQGLDMGSTGLGVTSAEDASEPHAPGKGDVLYLYTFSRTFTAPSSGMGYLAVVSMRP